MAIQPVNVDVYDEPIPVDAPAPRAAHGKYAAMYEKMTPGQWYKVAVTKDGHKKLMSKNIAFRKLGGKVSIRTEGDESFLYVLREA